MQQARHARKRQQKKAKRAQKHKASVTARNAAKLGVKKYYGPRGLRRGLRTVDAFKSNLFSGTHPEMYKAQTTNRSEVVMTEDGVDVHIAQKMEE